LVSKHDAQSHKRNRNFTQMSATEDELLRMSITGESPASSTLTFDREKAQGNECFGRGDYEDALVHYRAAGAENPSSPVPPSNAAMTLLRLKRPADALEAATSALELLAAHPDRPGGLQLTVKTLLRRATARTELKLYALAAHDLQEILILQPGHEYASRTLREIRANHGIGTLPGGTKSDRAPRIEELDDRTTSENTRERTPRIPAESALPARARSNRPSATRHTNGSSKAACDNGTTFEAAMPSSLLETMTESLVATSPRNGADFERAWRTLRVQPLSSRGRYIAEAVGASRIHGGLIGESITSQLLVEIASALAAALKENSDLAHPVVDVMRALTTVPRFDWTVMFFSEAEKEIVANLFDLIQGILLNAADLASVRSSFCL
jgi:Potential Monad-binding region of RPAP3